MAFLKLLESLRTPFWDNVMGIVTYLGDEYAYLAAVLLLLWCVDKKWGYRLYVFGMFANTLNQLLKALFLVPRPWVSDPGFSIVEAARAAASGYSFPSGHTQSATVLFLALALRKNRSRLRGLVWAICLALIFLTAFSRMYLGVHTPLDIGVSLVTGALCVFLLNPLMERAEKSEKGIWAAAIGVFAFALAFLALIIFRIPGEKNIAEFDQHALKNAYTIAGTTAGAGAAWILDIKHTRYRTEAIWWAQILKVALGLPIVLSIQILLKEPLYSLLNGHFLADALRYFLLSFAGAGLWPMTFRFFGKLGNKP
ncbi:MAG: phosphatase PAP2 family protein [Christensenellales bacterium]